MEHINKQQPLPEVPERPPVGRPLLAAAIVILIFFGGLGAWATLAPLDSAALAPGRVTVASNRKTVQHLEGGIVKELLVKEGDAVSGDQVLIQLDDTQARARLDLLYSRYDKLLATEARLEAERASAAGIMFPESLTSRRHQPPVAKILDGEEALFESRRRSTQGRIHIFHKRIAQLKNLGGGQGTGDAIDAHPAIRGGTDPLMRPEEQPARHRLVGRPRLRADQRAICAVELDRICAGAVHEPEPA